MDGSQQSPDNVEGSEAQSFDANAAKAAFVNPTEKAVETTPEQRQREAELLRANRSIKQLIKFSSGRKLEESEKAELDEALGEYSRMTGISPAEKIEATNERIQRDRINDPAGRGRALEVKVINFRNREVEASKAYVKTGAPPPAPSPIATS